MIVFDIFEWCWVYYEWSWTKFLKAMSFTKCKGIPSISFSSNFVENVDQIQSYFSKNGTFYQSYWHILYLSRVKSGAASLYLSSLRHGFATYVRCSISTQVHLDMDLPHPDSLGCWCTYPGSLGYHYAAPEWTWVHLDAPIMMVWQKLAKSIIHG